MKRDQFTEIDTDLIDREIGNVFLRRLKETHDLDEYQHWLQEVSEKVDNHVALIQAQLAEIDNAQEAILTERLDMQQRINAIQDEQKRQKAKNEAAGDFERLRLRSIKYDTLAAELKAQLPNRDETEENNELKKVRTYLSFQAEAQKLIEVRDKKPLSVRAEFFNLFLVQTVFTVVAPHWVRLDIYWRRPAWEQDSMYIFRKRGTKPRWTDEEREVVKAYYLDTPREALLQLLPTKTWRSIRSEALNLGVVRLGNFHSDTPRTLTWLDIEFMREQNIVDVNTISLASSQTERSAYVQKDRLAFHR